MSCSPHVQCMGALTDFYGTRIPIGPNNILNIIILSLLDVLHALYIGPSVAGEEGISLDTRLALIIMLSIRIPLK